MYGAGASNSAPGIAACWKPICSSAVSPMRRSNLSESELDDFEALLEAIDRDVFAWATGETQTPQAYDTLLFRRIVAFHAGLDPVGT